VGSIYKLTKRRIIICLARSVTYEVLTRRRSLVWWHLTY